MTPWPAAVAIMAPISGRLTDRFSPGALGGLGLAALSAGLVLLAVLPAYAGSPDLVWRLAVCGFGFGLFQSPNNKLIIMSAPRERSGGASGMLSTCAADRPVSWGSARRRYFRCRGLARDRSRSMYRCFARGSRLLRKRAPHTAQLGELPSRASSICCWADE